MPNTEVLFYVLFTEKKYQQQCHYGNTAQGGKNFGCSGNCVVHIGRHDLEKSKMQRLLQLFAYQVPVAQVLGGQAAVSVQRNGAHASIQSRAVHMKPGTLGVAHINAANVTVEGVVVVVAEVQTLHFALFAEGVKLAAVLLDQQATLS